VAMLSADHLPVGYMSKMTSVQGASWVDDVGGRYLCIGTDRRPRSPYTVNSGRVNGSGALSSPSTHSTMAGLTFDVGPLPTSPVYHVDTCHSRRLQTDPVLKVDSDNGS